MARKKYDLVVTTGEYQGRDGNTKREYKNVGAVLENEKGLYMVLDRTFNPAGVPNPENRSNLIVSMFEPREQNDGRGSQGGGNSQQRDTGTSYGGGYGAGGSPSRQSSGRPDFDDDIPF